MKKYDTIFLDRDGTLNDDPGYISSLDQFQFYEFTIPALKKMKNSGKNFCIITNQSGVGRGLIKPESLENINNYIIDVFRAENIPLLDIIVCHDHPDHTTSRRKPGSGMYLEAAKKYQITLSNCLMIGDSIIDIEAGCNLKMDTMLVLTGNGKITKERIDSQCQPDYITENLLTGADMLVLEKTL